MWVEQAVVIRLMFEEGIHILLVIKGMARYKSSRRLLVHAAHFVCILSR